ncbi:hypothetical protein ACWCPT_03190 [Streptomyces sp. NPDC002308]
MDVLTERTGLLVGVLEERVKETGRVVARQAFMVPEGGGLEWDVPLDRIRLVAGGSCAPAARFPLVTLPDAGVPGRVPSGASPHSGPGQTTVQAAPPRVKAEGSA